MATKRQKQAVFKQLLLPILIIIGALLYRPVSGLFHGGETWQAPPADENQLTVSYLDVGQGDATLIQKGGFHMLIDAGNNNKGETVVECLKQAGVKKLDVLVGTHPDSDHIGGLDTVIENIPVETLYLPKATKETKTYQDVEKAMKAKKLTAQMPEIGKEYTYEKNLVLRFLSPDETYSDANNNSLVVQAAYGKTRFLFMGDAEEEAEKKLVEKQYDLECDVLKLGHHGSHTATSQTFLQKADPVYAIISCGRDNSYGHPHAEVLARLEEEDVQIYRTDTMGTIQAVSDGEQVTLSTEQ
ncbi:MAG: MBL fold metallo-hydrolase [Lachnospiraceae bacterium]|nr:MBL fold metallo-hydrolase [Lachnospiraceae bacterium]